MKIKSLLITLISFCFILNAQSVDKKKRATRVSKGKSKTEVVKTTNEKVKSLTSNRSVAGKTKTKAVTKVRTKKAKSSGKLGVSKRVSTKSASIVSVGKEKPSPEIKKDCCDKDGKLLTKVNDKK
jgi:hypothetical protein